MTDNLSLYQAAHSTSTLEDQRLKIEMAVIRQMVSREELRLEWCSTDQQISDVLTKKGASSEMLRDVLANGHL